MEFIDERDEDGSRRTGKLFTLSELKNQKHTDHLAPFEDIFEFRSSLPSYNATIFRFPLRLKPSDLSTKCYSPEEIVEELLSGLERDAPHLLLFLKNVKRICLYKKDLVQGGKRTLVAEISIMSKSISTVIQRDKLKSMDIECHFVPCTVTVKFPGRSERNYHWMVCNTIGSISGNVLHELSEKLHVIPWAGVAFTLPSNVVCKPLNVVGSSEDEIIAKLIEGMKQCTPVALPSTSQEMSVCEGKLFCFLPLPVSTKLPVHVHGYFIPKDDRQAIKWPSSEDKSPEAQWNKELVVSLLAPTYFLAILARTLLFSYQPCQEQCNTDSFAIWPKGSLRYGNIWDELLSKVVSRIKCNAQLPLYWSQINGGCWVSSNEALFIEKEHAVIGSIALKLQIAIVCLPESVSRLISLMSSRHQNVIQNLTPVTLSHALLQRSCTHDIPQLTIEEKDGLCSYLCSSLESGEICKLLPSLPIFRCAPFNPPCFTSLCEDIIFPAPSIRFPPNVEFPTNILHVTGDNVQCLKTLLGKEPCSMATLVQQCVIPYSNSLSYPHRISDTVRVTLYQWILDHLQEKDHELIQFLSRTPILLSSVPNDVNWYYPNQLFHPDDRVNLSKFFHNLEVVYPNSCFQSYSSQLEYVGLKRWHKICSNEQYFLNFLISRAKKVSPLATNSLQVAQTISQNVVQEASVSKLFHQFLSKVADIPFIFCSAKPPEEFTKAGLPWGGSQKAHIPLKLLEVCPSSIAEGIQTDHIAGCSVPIINAECQHLISEQSLKVPTANDVLSHLKCVIDCRTLPRDTTSKMMICIYQYFARTDPVYLKNSDLPFFWSGSEFLNPTRVAYHPLEWLKPNYVSVIEVYGENFLPLEFWMKCGIRKWFDARDCMTMIDSMREFKFNKSDITRVVKLLEYVFTLKDHTSESSFLIPTQTGLLLPPADCVFDDRGWTERSAGLQYREKYNMVHELVPERLIRHFGVPALSSKIGVPRGLKIHYTQKGQHESLIRRIKGIIEDYKDNIDVFKELIQNAEDAGASEVKFLIDWRQHPTDSLLADGMKEWQGPALCAYNNGVFSDEDFDNICELAGATKMDDPTKIGRFGLGFCTVYHLTDLPMFVSRNCFTVFDPHRENLSNLVAGGSPGVQFNYVNQKEQLLSVYSDQMAPFEGLFGCKIREDKGEGYQGTLFRFPFRNQETSKKSSFSRVTYNKSNIGQLLKSLKDTADTLLVFLRNVRRVELYELHENMRPDQMQCLLSIEKKWVKPLTANFKDWQIQSLPPREKVDCGLFAIQCCSQNEAKVQNWMVSSAFGTGSSWNYIQSDAGKSKGLVPIAEVAVPVSESEGGTKVDSCKGKAFCFLPLSIPVDPLNCHINGCFDIAKDRKSLRDMHVDGSWNVLLVQDALGDAFIGLLQYLSQNQLNTSSLKTFYSLWPNGPEGSSLPGRLIPVFRKAVVEKEPLIVWSDCGLWLPLTNVKIFSEDFDILDPTISLEARNILVGAGHPMADVPPNLVNGFRSFAVPHPLKIEEFWACLLNNLQRLLPVVVCNQIRFILIHYETLSLKHASLTKMLLESNCIPCESNGTLSLVKPSKAIDPTNKYFRLLYDVSDGRFPIEALLKDGKSQCALKKLNMATIQLRNVDIIDRVKQVSALGSPEKCMKMCESILVYLEYHLGTVGNEIEVQKLLKALSDLPFLPIMMPPSPLLPFFKADTGFEAPSKLYDPNEVGVVFTLGAVADGLTRSPKLLEAFKGVWKPLPHVENVLGHLTKVVGWWCDVQGKIDAISVEFLNKELPSLYRYLSSKCCENLEVFQSLKNKPWIWQDGKFLSTDTLVISADCSRPPFLQELSLTNKEFSTLFKRFGVESIVNDKVALIVLKRITQSLGQSAIHDLNVISFINKLLSKFLHCPKETVYLPDEKGILRPAHDLAYRDHSLPLPPTLAGKKMHFLHQGISKHLATNLGVKDVMLQLSDEMIDQRIFTGEDFGQHEDICDRLNGILTQYEPNISIFREFIQNAEDAGATEIAFIIDERTTHPCQTLFTNHDNWKSLQNMPALLIFNNRKFTEDDLHGIAKVGVGSKRGQTDKIGRFGIGFNVAYHVTDAPMFVSYGQGGHPEHFCLFDPNRQCLPYARTSFPGRLWRNQPEMNLSSMTDQLAPFLRDLIPKMAVRESGSFHSLSSGWENGYTMFRLPLTRTSSARKWESKLTGCKMTVDTLKQMCHTLFDETAEMLIFLNNVRRISVFNVSCDGQIVNNSSTFAVPSKMKDGLDPTTYAENVKKARSQMKLNEFPPSFSLVHLLKVTARSNKGKEMKRKWFVSKRFGSTDLPLEITKKGHTHSLLPVGGVAACIQQDLKQNGKVFVSLPLEDNPSCLPVHINGHFWVDQSRKHLQHTKTEDLKDWNKMVAEQIIARCYSDLLQCASKLCDKRELIKWFYTLFPGLSGITTDGSKRGTGSQSIKAFDLVRNVYQFLWKDKAAILVAKQPKSGDDVSWLGLEGSKDWVKGYFFLDSQYDQLPSTLVQLGVKITDAPHGVFYQLTKACSHYQGRIDCNIVIQCLRPLCAKLDKIKSTILPVVSDIWLYLLTGRPRVTSLPNLPIMLTEDQNLCIFQGPKFVPDPKILALLPDRHCDFMSRTIYSQFRPPQPLYDCCAVKRVDPHYVAQYIKLPKCTAPIPLDDKFKPLLIKFWKWIISIYDNRSYLQHFKEFIAIPTNYHHLVIPVQLADCILSQPSKLEILSKLPVPVTDFSTLGLSVGETTQAASLLKTVHVADETNPLDIIKILNNCSRNFPPEIKATSKEVAQFTNYIGTSKCLDKMPDYFVAVMKKLPLYNVLGTNTDVRKPINGSDTVYLIPDNVCTDGLLEVQKSLSITYLVRDESFSLGLLKLVGVHIPTVSEFYRVVVFPTLQQMSEVDKLKQVCLITNSRKFFPIDTCQTLIRGLSSTPFVIVKNTSKKVSELFDPTEDFTSFLPKEQHLPKPWCKGDLLHFAREHLGLQCLPNWELWLEAAKYYSEPSICSDAVSGILLKTFTRLLSKTTQNKLPMPDPKFLQEVKGLQFVQPATSEKLVKLEQTFSKAFKPPQKRICFNGSALCVESRTVDLIGLVVKVVTCNANEISTYPEACSALGIVPMSVSLVCQNLLQLSRIIRDSQVVIDSAISHNLTSTFCQHYQYLLEHCSSNSEFCAIKSLISKQACWIIPSGSAVNLVRLEEIVEQCSPTEVCLSPYLVTVPKVLDPYRVLMRKLGMKERPHVSHYVTVLQSIRLKHLQHKLTTSQYQKATVAYNALVNTLRMKGESDPDVKYVQSLGPELILPSDDGFLSPSGHLLLSDSPRIRRWVPKGRYAFVCRPPLDVKTNVRTLPECLGVNKLSNIVKEVPALAINSKMNMCVFEHWARDRGKNSYYCNFATMLCRLITSKEFSAGLCRIIQNKQHRPLNEIEKKAVDSVQQLRIKCVQSIETVLQEKEEFLDVDRHVRYCLIFEETMFITFHPPSKQVESHQILQHCTEELWKVLGDSIEPLHVSAILNSQPQSLEHVLDDRNLKSFDGDVPISLGMPVSLSHGSEFLLFGRYSNNELVKYCQPDGTFVFARISRVMTSDGFTLPSVDLKLSLQTDDNVMRYSNINSLLICKLTTPDQVDSLNSMIEEDAATSQSDVGIFYIPINPSDVFVHWLEKTMEVAKYGCSPKQMEFVLERILFHVHFLCCSQKQRVFKELLRIVIEFLQRKPCIPVLHDKRILTRVFTDSKVEVLDTLFTNRQNVLDVYKSQSSVISGLASNIPKRMWDHLSDFVEDMDIVKEARVRTGVREADEWKEQAEKDLKVAEYLHPANEHFHAVCFYCHEAVLKGMKAIVCVHGGLRGNLESSEDIELLCKEFTVLGDHGLQKKFAWEYVSTVGKHGACCRQPDARNESKHTAEVAEGVLKVTRVFFENLNQIQKLKFKLSSSPAASYTSVDRHTGKLCFNQNFSKWRGNSISL